MYTSNSTTLRPEAYITVKKNRLKLYDGKNHYLKNKSNFEIELFNPTGQRVLAKIWVNGTLISPAGIVINANQRAHIERFIDTPEKFQFNTFEVDNVRETIAARENNGAIKVCFYAEKPAPKTLLNDYIYPKKYGYEEYNGWPPYNGVKYGGNSSIVGTSITRGITDVPFTLTTSGNTLSLTGTNTVNAFYANSGTVSNCMAGPTLTANYSAATMDCCVNETVETGRVVSGGKSDQTFGTTYGDFNDYLSHTYEFHLLPMSLKPVEVNQVRNYCTCGTRIKKSSWQFCPNCGAAC